jgi:translocator protein
MTTATVSAASIDRRPSTACQVLALVLFLGIAFAVAGFGSLATFQNVDGWYADAEKAFWTPPNVVFGPVWTVLYTVMSVAAWLVWREPASAGRRSALAAYVIQLVLNAIWTPVFFGLYPLVGPPALWVGLAVILALDVMVLITMVRFWRVRRIAAVLLIPYWAWVLYATTLNAALAVLNP